MKVSYACLIPTLLISNAFSQSFNGSLLGTVHDSSGATVPSATVTAINTETNAQVEGKSAGDGKYVLSPLPAGSYRLEANAPGVKKVIQAGILLQVQQHARLGIPIAAGEDAKSLLVSQR